MGSLHEKSIVKLDATMGLVVFLVNTFVFPGAGTIIAYFLSSDKPNETIIVGIIQILTFEFLVGWIWAIITGWAIYQKSK